MQVPEERYNKYLCFFCLDHGPDIIISAEIVLKARMTEFCMHKYDGREFTTGERINFLEDSTYSDEWISDKKLFF